MQIVASLVYVHVYAELRKLERGPWKKGRFFKVCMCVHVRTRACMCSKMYVIQKWMQKSSSRGGGRELRKRKLGVG